MQLGICTGRRYPKDFPVYGECVINIPDFIPEKVTKILHKILGKGCEKCESCGFYQKGRCFYNSPIDYLDNDFGDNLLF